jgi:hypothetical protein
LICDLRLEDGGSNRKHHETDASPQSEAFGTTRRDVPVYLVFVRQEKLDGRHE